MEKSKHNKGSKKKYAKNVLLDFIYYTSSIEKMIIYQSGLCYRKAAQTDHRDQQTITFV